MIKHTPPPKPVGRTESFLGCGAGPLVTLVYKLLFSETVSVTLFNAGAAHVWVHTLTQHACPTLGPSTGIAPKVIMLATWSSPHINSRGEFRGCLFFLAYTIGVLFISVGVGGNT